MGNASRTAFNKWWSEYYPGPSDAPAWGRSWALEGWEEGWSAALLDQRQGKGQPGDYKRALGVIPWQEGDPMPEDVIRAIRDGTYWTEPVRRADRPVVVSTPLAIDHIPVDARSKIGTIRGILRLLSYLLSRWRRLPWASRAEYTRVGIQEVKNGPGAETP